jgi:hypothetical protein
MSGIVNRLVAIFNGNTQGAVNADNISSIVVSTSTHLFQFVTFLFNVNKTSSPFYVNLHL